MDSYPYRFIKYFFLILISLFIIYPSFIFSQGNFLKKDESAVRILTSYSKRSDFSGYSLGADYNYKGIVSLGVLTFNGLYTDDVTKFSATGLFLGAYPFKPSVSFPISFEFGIGIFFDSYDDNAIDTLFFEFQETQFIIYIGALYHFFVKESFQIVPGFGYNYTIFYREAVNLNGRRLEGKERFSNLYISMDFASRVSKSILLSVIPEYAFWIEGENKSNTTFTISFNFNIIL